MIGRRIDVTRCRDAEPSAKRATRTSPGQRHGFHSIEKDDADPNGKGKADEEDEESFDEEEEA